MALAGFAVQRVVCLNIGQMASLLEGQGAAACFAESPPHRRRTPLELVFLGGQQWNGVAKERHRRLDIPGPDAAIAQLNGLASAGGGQLEGRGKQGVTDGGRIQRPRSVPFGSVEWGDRGG